MPRIVRGIAGFASNQAQTAKCRLPPPTQSAWRTAETERSRRNEASQAKLRIDLIPARQMRPCRNKCADCRNRRLRGAARDALLTCGYRGRRPGSFSMLGIPPLPAPLPPAVRRNRLMVPSPSVRATDRRRPPARGRSFGASKTASHWWRDHGRTASGPAAVNLHELVLTTRERAGRASLPSIDWLGCPVALSLPPTQCLRHPENAPHPALRPRHRSP
jgi:hypothetical protein